MTENEITYKIRHAIFAVYNQLGPGLLESTYHKVLLYQLKKEGLQVRTEQAVPIIYDNIVIDEVPLRLDIIVEDRVVVEIKSVEELKKVHYKQLLTYLRLLKKHLGILVNFDTDDIMASIHRIINGYQ